MTLIHKARQNRQIALRTLRARESNIFAEDFGVPSRDRPGRG